MRSTIYAWLGTLVLIAGFMPAGLAAEALAMPQNVPEKLKLKEECTLVHKSAAKGFQVYTCSKDGDGFIWKITPDADLMDDKGVKEGKHLATTGATWQLDDGSKVVAKKVADEPNKGACPLLLLSVTENSKTGALKDVIFIHRLDTTGGVAPAEAPTAANLGKVVRVSYTATYYFYAKK